MEYKIPQIRNYGCYQSEKIGAQWYNIVYIHAFRKNDINREYPIKLHFIHMFDNEDLYEFFSSDDDNEVLEKESFTDEDLKTCRNELVLAAAESILYGDDLDLIVDKCNYTIERYA